MANVTIRGSLLPFLQDTAYDFDPTRGYIFRLNYKGASQQQMLNLQQDYVRNGIACRLIFHQGDAASLEVEDSTQQFTLDVWQLLANEESRDGLSHPVLLNYLDEDDIALMRQHLENNDEIVDVFTGSGDLAAFNGTPVPGFYELQQRGATDYRRGNYVLKHTTNAPNRWTSNIADVGVDQIYTPAQLLSEVQDSGLWINPIPGRLAYKIANIPTQGPESEYLWGWLKSGSTETTAANNRIEISTEYTLELWSIQYYAPY
jgi:hypothetical protein